MGLPFLFEFDITVRREADPPVTEDRAPSPLQQKDRRKSKDSSFFFVQVSKRGSKEAAA